MGLDQFCCMSVSTSVSRNTCKAPQFPLVYPHTNRTGVVESDVPFLLYTQEYSLLVDAFRSHSGDYRGVHHLGAGRSNSLYQIADLGPFPYHIRCCNRVLRPPIPGIHCFQRDFL